MLNELPYRHPDPFEAELYGTYLINWSAPLFTGGLTHLHYRVTLRHLSLPNRLLTANTTSTLTYIGYGVSLSVYVTVVDREFVQQLSNQSPTERIEAYSQCPGVGTYVKHYHIYTTPQGGLFFFFIKQTNTVQRETFERENFCEFRVSGTIRQSFLCEKGGVPRGFYHACIYVLYHTSYTAVRLWVRLTQYPLCGESMKVFATKCYISSIQKSFLPRKVSLYTDGTLFLLRYCIGRMCAW